MDIYSGIINRIDPNNIFSVKVTNYNTTITVSVTIIVYDRDTTPFKEAYKVTVYIPPQKEVSFAIPIYCARYDDSNIIEQFQLRFTTPFTLVGADYKQLYDPTGCQRYFTLT